MFIFVNLGLDFTKHHPVLAILGLWGAPSEWTFEGKCPELSYIQKPENLAQSTCPDHTSIELANTSASFSFCGSILTTRLAFSPL